MNYKYETISQKENIKNKDLAYALDYLERHAKDFKLEVHKTNWTEDRYTVFINNDTEIFFWKQVEVAPVDMTDPENLDYWEDYIYVPTEFFCKQVPQFYSYIKARWSK